MNQIFNREVNNRILFTCSFKEAWEAGYGENTVWREVLKEKGINTTGMEINVKIDGNMFSTDIAVYGRVTESDEAYHARLVAFRADINLVLLEKDKP